MKNDLHKSPSPGATQRPRLYTIMWAHKGIVLGGLLAGMLAGVIYTALRPLTFTASSTLIFPSSPSSRLSFLPGGGGSGDLPSIPLLDGAMMIPRPGTSASSASMLLQSRQARQDVLNMLRTPEYGAIDLGAHLQMNAEDTLAALRENVICTVGKQGELIIAYRDSDARVAYQGARAFVAELGALTSKLSLDPATSTKTFLEGRMQDAHASLERIQAELLAFKQKNRIVDISLQGKAVADQYAQIQRDLASAKLEALTAERQAGLSAKNAAALINACVDPTPGTHNPLNQLYQKVTQAESELALLRSQYTADHPEVVAKRDALRQVQGQLKAEIGRQLSLVQGGASPAVNALVLQAANSKARVSGLQMLLGQSQQTVDALPSLQMRYAQLMGEAGAAETEYNFLRQEYEKACLLIQRQGPSFTVLDDAQLPARQDPQGRMMLIIGLMLLGGTLACGLPYWRWHTVTVQYEDTMEQQAYQLQRMSA